MLKKTDENSAFDINTISYFWSKNGFTIKKYVIGLIAINLLKKLVAFEDDTT